MPNEKGSPRRKKRRITHKMRIGYKRKVYKMIRIGKDNLIVTRRHPDTLGPTAKSKELKFRCSLDLNPNSRSNRYVNRYADGSTPANAIAGYILKYYGVEHKVKHPREPLTVKRKRTKFYSDNRMRMRKKYYR